MPGSTFSWGGLTWGYGQLKAFTAYLNAFGTSYSTWAGHHPDAAAILTTAPSTTAPPVSTRPPTAGPPTAGPGPDDGSGGATQAATQPRATGSSGGHATAKHPSSDGKPSVS